MEWKRRLFGCTIYYCCRFLLHCYRTNEWSVREKRRTLTKQKMKRFVCSITKDSKSNENEMERTGREVEKMGRGKAECITFMFFQLTCYCFLFSIQSWYAITSHFCLFNYILCKIFTMRLLLFFWKFRFHYQYY